MNFNEELKKLRTLKMQFLSETKSIENEKQAELEQINSKYDELIRAKHQEFVEHNIRTDAYRSLIEYCSYFDAKNIGTAIASLIRIFEGTNYIYQEAEYHTSKSTKHVKIVVAEDSRHNCYSCDGGESLNSIVKNKKAIILSEDIRDKKIPFYHVSKKTHSLEQCIKFDKFSYVKDFIDELISYKIEKNLEDISSDEIERLKRNFILSRVEQIEENYRLIDQQQEEQMKQKLDADKENRKLLLKRILNKKNK